MVIDEPVAHSRRDKGMDDIQLPCLGLYFQLHSSNSG